MNIGSSNGGSDVPTDMDEEGDGSMHHDVDYPDEDMPQPYDDYEEGYSDHNGEMYEGEEDDSPAPGDDASTGEQGEESSSSRTKEEDSEPHKTSCALGPTHSTDLRLEALCTEEDEGKCTGSMCLYDVSLSKVRYFLSRVLLDRHKSKALHI